jgi:hypothetical protein
MSSNDISIETVLVYLELFLLTCSGKKYLKEHTRALQNLVLLLFIAMEITVSKIEYRFLK